jgi:Ca2+-binding RTX toxin-like protein
MSKLIRKPLAVLIMVLGLLVTLAAGAALAAQVTCPTGGGSCYGTSGNDFITGTNFADDIYGYAGNDTIHPGKGSDWVFPSTGDDRIVLPLGSGGKDYVSGWDGDDHIDIWDLDHYDTANCGRGNDTVHADSPDSIRNDCENVIKHP